MYYKRFLKTVQYNVSKCILNLQVSKRMNLPKIIEKYLLAEKYTMVTTKLAEQQNFYPYNRTEF